MSTKDQVEELIRDYLDYEDSKFKLPTLVYTKFKDFKSYGYDLILEILLTFDEDIRYGLENGIFSSDNARVNYIFAIVQNHAVEIVREKRLAEEQRRQITDNIDPNCIDELEISYRKQPVRDIRRFLDADDE